MDLFLTPGAGKPLTAQLYEQLRLAIASGRMRPADQLPPSRELARQLGISRHTVTTAYDRLVAEGYVEGRAGGGSVVTEAMGTAPSSHRRATALRPARLFEDATPIFQPMPDDKFDLRTGLIDPALFPLATWRRRLAAAWSSGAGNGPSLNYGFAWGHADLRQATAAWVARSRSVVATADTVIITAGSLHAIDLIGRVMIEPGDCVAVEDPGYRPVHRLFRNLRAAVIGVPVDDEGLVVDLLPPSARIVYVTPSHQYPLGMTMSMRRRQALLRWAEHRNAAIIEDDYDSEFRYVDRPLEPLQRLDEHGRVIYVGSFSKIFTPSIRLGFAVVPESLIEPIVALRQCSDWHCPISTQQALAGFIEDGLLEKHIRRCGHIFAERRRVLTDALRDDGPLGRYLAALPSNAGLHIATKFRAGLDEDTVVPAVRREGIAIFGTRDSCYDHPGLEGLLLGFGKVATSDLPAALAMLGDILASCAR